MQIILHLFIAKNLKITIIYAILTKQDASVAKRLCPGFPSQSRRFDSGHSLHFFWLFAALQNSAEPFFVSLNNYIIFNLRDDFMDSLLKGVCWVNSYLSDYVLIVLLAGTGIYFTFRTRFVQVRCFGEGWKRVLGDFSLHGKRNQSCGNQKINKLPKTKRPDQFIFRLNILRHLILRHTYIIS